MRWLLQEVGLSQVSLGVLSMIALRRRLMGLCADLQLLLVIMLVALGVLLVIALRDHGVCPMVFHGGVMRGSWARVITAYIAASLSVIAVRDPVACPWVLLEGVIRRRLVGLCSDLEQLLVALGVLLVITLREHVK